jgi:hypothetical protein
MEQMMACLLAEIRANNKKFEVLHGTRLPTGHLQSQDRGHSRRTAKMHAHQERMEASMNAWQRQIMACQEAMEACLKKAKAKPEKMKAGLEEMEVTVDVFVERLNKAVTMNLEANQAKTEAYLDRKQQTPEETEATAEHEEAAKEAAVETVGAQEDRTGDQPCQAGTHRRFCKRSHRRTDGQEEMTVGLGMQQWNKEQGHKRAITSGKQENTQQDFQADSRAAGRKANSRDFH